MKNYTIEIEIDERGNLIADTKGMEGKVCIDELDAILKDLGHIEEEKNKPEFYKKTQISRTQKLKK